MESCYSHTSVCAACLSACVLHVCLCLLCVCLCVLCLPVCAACLPFLVYSAQYCMILLLEKWRKSIDNSGCAGPLRTGMSKAFDSFSHGLLIAKLSAYGLDIVSLWLIHSYLTHCHQRIRVFFQLQFMVWNYKWCTTRLDSWTYPF